MAQLPISEFLTTRLKEYDPKFELRPGTGFERLFIKPMQFIVQPFADEADAISTGQSLKKILETEDPDAFDEEAVDAINGNYYVDRRLGEKAGGTVRVYYNTPVDREYPTSGATFVSSNSKLFFNTAPFSITEAEMSVNIESGLYYFDIEVIAEQEGEEYKIAENQIIELQGDTDYAAVTNKLAFETGSDRETNTEYIERTKQSIGVRDLVVPKGFRGIMFDTFKATLREVTPIGFGDEEMMRDIVYNTHIGGRVDGYVKTSKIRTGYKNFVGMGIDPTRQSFSSSNVQLMGTAYSFIGFTNLDRSNGRSPVIQEIKVAYEAEFVSLADLSSPIDLSSAQYVKMGIDGQFKEFRIAGVNPASTNRNEIINLINYAFGVNVAFPQGKFIRIKSPTTGLTSEIVIDNPSVGGSPLMLAFGLSTGGAPHTFSGDGPITFLEGLHYEIKDEDGMIKRILGPVVLGVQITGESTADSDLFDDFSSGIFMSVEANDIITIQSGDDAGDYRVLERVSNNRLKLDQPLTATGTGISYYITRSGIKSGEVVYAQFYFNPISVDIGKLIKLDSTGRNRGIRPGREDFTITDLAFLRILSIDLIDAITGEPTGEVLNGNGGYGRGGYGSGPYGVGEGQDYYMVVNSPHERFSMFEDSYIVFGPGVEGLSVRVNYEYVPEIEAYHNFVRGEVERVLDGDILIKHYLPAYVSGTIQYSVDETDTSIPDNDTLTAGVKEFINQVESNKPLEVSDIMQYMVSQVDPYARYKNHITPFTLNAMIHNVNGTLTGVQDSDKLVVPTLDPFPLDTDQPLSSRIVHWLGGDIVLERV